MFKDPKIVILIAVAALIFFVVMIASGGMGMARDAQRAKNRTDEIKLMNENRNMKVQEQMRAIEAEQASSTSNMQATSSQQ
jgi:hypothetical protein